MNTKCVFIKGIRNIYILQLLLGDPVIYIKDNKISSCTKLQKIFLAAISILNCICFYIIISEYFKINSVYANQSNFLIRFNVILITYCVYLFDSYIILGRRFYAVEMCLMCQEIGRKVCNLRNKSSYNEKCYTNEWHLILLLIYNIYFVIVYVFPIYTNIYLLLVAYVYIKTHIIIDCHILYFVKIIIFLTLSLKSVRTSLSKEIEGLTLNKNILREINKNELSNIVNIVERILTCHGLINLYFKLKVSFMFILVY